MADLTGMMQAAAGQAGGDGAYIEDVFSTYLYTGNSSTQTITNGIDLSGEGGLVWFKSRSQATRHILVNTIAGPTKDLSTNSSAAQDTNNILSSFNADGFTLNTGNYTNINTYTYASWTFRKAPKFFDVVTYTGNGVAGRQIAHNLGSVPGCVIVKRTNLADPWRVYHRSLGNTEHINLDTNEASSASSPYWNSTTPTSTVFTVGSGSDVNASGSTYVAYLFAHDAGGFGDDGEQNVISCGSYVGNDSTNVINFGFEPQWLLIKRATGAARDWVMVDVMRGFNKNADNALVANTSAAEAGGVGVFGAMQPTATGFELYNANSNVNASGSTYIYIAIRRGPMKTPTAGTEVFAIDTLSTTPPSYTSGFPVDMAMASTSSISSSFYNDVVSRLTGTKFLRTSSTAAESSETYYKTDFMTGWDNRGGTNADAYSWMFRRAPGFFDVVCYKGTDIAHTEAHNLSVAPEMIIVKSRSAITSWSVLHTSMNTTGGDYIRLNLTAAKDQNIAIWNSTLPTNAVFTVGVSDQVNHSYLGATYIAYLFATLAGVSKVGGYTGTGTTLQINCGFSAGARFVMIKRTDSTGDWYVWDSARGIIAGNDPYLLLNSNAGEVTSTDYIDPLASGFEISSTAPAAINASGGSFIFLAIA